MRNDEKPLPRWESRVWLEALAKAPFSEQVKLDPVLEQLKNSICEEIQESIRVWDEVESRSFLIRLDGVERMVVIFFSVTADDGVELLSWGMGLEKAA